MAIVARIKAGTMTGSGDEASLILPPPPLGRVQGVIRLWTEQPSPPAAPGIPLAVSYLFLVVGEDIGPTSGPVAQRYGEAVKLGDIQRLQGGYEKLLSDRGIALEDYVEKTSFVADLAVPASLLEGYTG